MILFVHDSRQWGGRMNKYEKLNELLKKGNGYLFTSEVEKNEISRTN